MSCGGQERARRKDGAAPFIPKKGERLLALLKEGVTLDAAHVHFPELAADEFALLVEIARAHSPEMFPEVESPESE